MNTTENIEKTKQKTHDFMIPSGVNIENKALQPDIILQYKKGEEGIAKWGVNTSDFRWNNAEIKNMTKYQDLKNEVKRSWKLKNAKVVPVMIKTLTGMMKKNLTEILKIIPGNIITNYSWKLSGSATILKRALGNKLKWAKILVFLMMTS